VLREEEIFENTRSLLFGSKGAGRQLLDSPIYTIKLAYVYMLCWKERRKYLRGLCVDEKITKRPFSNI
jgi:hypothetical protein